MDSYNSPSTKPLYRGTQIVWYVFGLLEAILALRFLLKLLGANPSAGFTSFVYGIASPFVSPFLNVFKITKVEGSTFEWTTLLAMIVYGFIAMALTRLFVMGRTVSTPQAAVRLENQDK